MRAMILALALLAGCAPSTWRELEVRRTLTSPLPPDTVARCIMAALDEAGAAGSTRYIPLPGGRTVIEHGNYAPGFGMAPPLVHDAWELTAQNGGTLVQWRAVGIRTEARVRRLVTEPIETCSA